MFRSRVLERQVVRGRQATRGLGHLPGRNHRQPYALLVGGLREGEEAARYSPHHGVKRHHPGKRRNIHGEAGVLLESDQGTIRKVPSKFHVHLCLRHSNVCSPAVQVSHGSLPPHQHLHQPPAGDGSPQQGHRVLQ